MMNAAERNDENIKKSKKLKKGLLISGIISIILGCLSIVVGVGMLIFAALLFSGYALFYFGSSIFYFNYGKPKIKNANKTITYTFYEKSLEIIKNI